MCKIKASLLRSKIALKGFNQKTLSEKIGISPITLSNILAGKNLPSLSIMRSLEKELDLTPQDLKDIFFLEGDEI